MRLTYADALNFDRVIRVFFYTSNVEKLMQARLMFVRSGYELRHYKGEHEPYDEDYELGTRVLLERAIVQVNREFGKRSVFFVEDTSVRIEAYSTPQLDYPGLRVKEWFSETNFAEVDAALHQRGNNRRATVKSDIALYVPTLSRPLYFHGETRGSISVAPPTYQASPQYPWLTPTTFNGWFVPDGATRTLGEMTFEESLEYDFRAKSLAALIMRLDELNSALNLRRGFYTTRSQEIASKDEPLLLDSRRIIIILIGFKCAGKTTFSDYLATRDGVSAIEASAVFRDIIDAEGATVTTHEDALKYLSINGFDLVSRQIDRYLENSDHETTVISGLRTVEEILFIKRRHANAKVVLVDADVKTRFQRHIDRGRDREVRTFSDFLEMDSVQSQFGAMRVASEIADVVLRNDGTLEAYHQKINELLQTLSRPAGAKEPGRNLSEFTRCLQALAEINHRATCDEISAQTRNTGSAVRKYNTNRALKDVPEFATRIVEPGRLLSYEIKGRGRELLALLQLQGAVETSA